MVKGATGRTYANSEARTVDKEKDKDGVGVKGKDKMKDRKRMGRTERTEVQIKQYQRKGKCGG